jgi:chemotaxis protein methyltransferase CheR
VNQGADEISELDYRKLSDLIRCECGIVFTHAKRTMVETRLRKRARAAGISSLSAYCEYLHTAQGRRSESPHLIDALTTHKTDFFREPAHFDYLVSRIIPDLTAAHEAGIRRPLLVWSSACSTGEEPYTLAMVLSDYSGSLKPRSYRFRIEATDISKAVVETAMRAVYPETVVRPVPESLRRRYLLRSKDASPPLVRLTAEIRSLIQFRQLNLMDPDYGFAEPLDVVFCRNVMIYFDRPVQQRVLAKITATLRQGGYLVMGHSESLNGLDLPLAQVAPTVYRRIDG